MTPLIPFQTAPSRRFLSAFPIAVPAPVLLGVLEHIDHRPSGRRFDPRRRGYAEKEGGDQQQQQQQQVFNSKDIREDMSG